MAASRSIIVAGAGIGGLTAALALAAKGFRVAVLEKAERLEEAGAGLQLSPNASRVLIELGLERRLGECAVVPEAVTVMSGPVTAGFSDHEEIARADLTDRNGELLARDLPVKDLYARPHVFWDKDQAAHAGHASAGWPDAASTNA